MRPAAKYKLTLRGIIINLVYYRIVLTVSSLYFFSCVYIQPHLVDCLFLVVTVSGMDPKRKDYRAE